LLHCCYARLERGREFTTTCPVFLAVTAAFDLFLVGSPLITQ
jgi:hypothetical protein